VCKIIGGSGFPERYQGRKGLPYPFVKVSDMNLPGNEEMLTRAENTVDDEMVKALGARLLPKGAIVFPKVGAALLTNKRRRLGVPAAVDNNCMGLVASGVNEQYLFYWSQTIDLARLSQNGALPSINGSAVSELEMLLPPDNEQRKIAGILSAWGKSVGALRSRLDIALDCKRGLMQQLLTGKTRFKEFKNESWRMVKIGSLLEECDRYMTWSDDKAFRFASIRRRSGGLFDRGTFYGREVKTKVLKSLKAGDFLISKRQVVHGAWAMVTKPFDGFGVSDEYDVLVNRDPKTLDMRFFNYLSQTQRLWHMAYLASNGVHIEKLIFDFDDFAKEKVRIPPTVEEQAMIVDVLSACDREIELLEKQLEALKEQKRGLMQKLLTGEIRVKVKG
jgi:type I restriction enzyme S subunit